MGERLTRTALLAIACLAAVVLGRAQSLPLRVDIPKNATALEGVPEVRIDTMKDSATRRELDATEAAKSPLTIKIVDGRFYWAGREGTPLTVTSTGEFT
jgi:hypothetical protein